MPLTPGLVANIPQAAQPEEVKPPESDVIIEAAEDGADLPQMDDKGNVLSIEHPDGSITVTLDGSPLIRGDGESPKGWFDNFVDRVDDLELNRIAYDLMRGIEEDIQSRKDWIEDRAKGIRLMGLKVEVPGVGGSAEGAPVEGMSRVRHPLLLEAVLRFQANARSELLPVDGPVKVRNDGNNANYDEDMLANKLEKDLNHYLTATASEYYPDTDRMLLMLGFGGTSFKKVYYCPLRNRPVSESVDADDLIVNNGATDLQNAKRITHRTFMKPSTLKRLQILGVYRDTELGQPSMANLDSVQREKAAQQGLQISTFNPDDRDREIYECYCELNLKGFEHKYEGKDSGLEIPYAVTIDVSSKKILSIRRNYDESDMLPEARVNFVKYTFVPGMGFYDIGLLNILGNTTNAVTAAWREMLDAGMYSNFPGFLLADTGGRQNTNIFRVPPGGGALVKTGGMPISQAVMPLPYKDPSQALMNLVENMAQTGMRVGGTSEQQVGEGRADAPVGTTLAMIEQAQKILNSVHKRLHAAQAEEFKLLVRCFKEHPESFWQRNKKPAYAWDEKTFLQALEDCDLVPQADPNTSSHTQRLMKIMALKQLQAAQPTLYDPVAIDTAALKAIGWSNPEQFLAPQNAQQQPPPEIVKGMADIKARQQDADARMMTARAKMAETQAKIQQGALAPKGGVVPTHPDELQAGLLDAQAKILSARYKAQELPVRLAEAQLEARTHMASNESRERVERMIIEKDKRSDLMDLEKERLAGQIKVMDIRRSQ